MRAINDKPRPGLSATERQTGNYLLADKVVELEFAGSISLETVRQILKKTNSRASPR